MYEFDYDLGSKREECPNCGSISFRKVKEFNSDIDDYQYYYLCSCCGHVE